MHIFDYSTHCVEWVQLFSQAVSVVLNDGKKVSKLQKKQINPIRHSAVCMHLKSANVILLGLISDVLYSICLSFVTSPKEVVFWPMSVCLLVSLSKGLRKKY